MRKQWSGLLSVLALAVMGCQALPPVSTTIPLQTLTTFGLRSNTVLTKFRSNVPENYYQAASGKTGQDLLKTLNQVVAKHQDLGYDHARDVMFGEADDPDQDDVVACVYTGRTVSNVHDRDSAYQNGQGLNAEHTWPQSKGAEGVAKADLHHLFSSDIRTNGLRSSYPFGVVKQTIAFLLSSQSKLGVNERGVTVFEPRDQHKGNVARAILYFYTVYGLGGKANLSNFKQEEEVLKQWNKLDPVDAAEMQRNDVVFKAQGNRNPYIDHPEFVDQVGKFLSR